MQINVRFSGLFRTMTGKKEVVVQIDQPSSVSILLNRLALLDLGDFPDKVLSPILLERNRAPIALILHNHVHLHEVDDLERPLSDGDQVSFIPPMEGGLN
jgi:molybdopterin converting factor small subunit